MSQTALITGASSGLGLEFAKLFAADHTDVVLVARRKDRLDALAAQLSSEHRVKAQVIAADLMSPSGAQGVIDEVNRLGLTVDFLVNNAGFGTNGPFAQLDPAKELAEVQVNVAALVMLTRAFLPGMLARKQGRVLNVGSTAGFQPGPFMAVYYASKAFVNSFTEALWYELRGTGVTATVSCPGATLTEFAAVAGTDSSRLFRIGAMTAHDVARQAFRAMHAGKPMVVHGLKNRLGAFGLRFSPRALVRVLAASLNGPAGDDKPRLNG
ncbi:MAG: SDR family NAD(P)-dependent oxidoreductase [Myxococcaceae bacterium]